MRNATAALALVVAAFLGVGLGATLFVRGRVERAQDARESAQREHLVELARCLTLLEWTLRPGAEGGAVVRAEVLPGRDGRVALDARGGRGTEDVLVPELQREPLVPAVVQAGRPVHLERRLRRVRPGDAEELSLRFSCLPPGPQGVFGVIEYTTGARGETPDGFGGLLRSLPPPAR